jgi:hypothetical protein
MRIPRLPLLLFPALLALACSSDVDGADSGESTIAASETSESDKLVLRAIQLLDSATEVVVEATEHSVIETSSVTLKSLGIELGEIRTELAANKLTLETYPGYGEQWNAAKLRLRNATSLMVADNPEVAKTLTGVLKGMSLDD